jgi:hypothetical protein
VPPSEDARSASGRLRSASGETALAGPGGAEVEAALGLEQRGRVVGGHRRPHGVELADRLVEPAEREQRDPAGVAKAGHVGAERDRLIDVGQRGGAVAAGPGQRVGAVVEVGGARRLAEVGGRQPGQPPERRLAVAAGQRAGGQRHLERGARLAVDRHPARQPVEPAGAGVVAGLERAVRRARQPEEEQPEHQQAAEQREQHRRAAVTHRGPAGGGDERHGGQDPRESEHTT